MRQSPLTPLKGPTRPVCERSRFPPNEDPEGPPASAKRIRRLTQDIANTEQRIATVLEQLSGLIPTTTTQAPAPGAAEDGASYGGATAPMAAQPSLHQLDGVQKISECVARIEAVYQRLRARRGRAPQIAIPALPAAPLG